MSKSLSCKGVMLAGAVSVVRAAISQGTLQRAAVEARLPAEHGRFLDETVEPTRWYPVEALASYLDLTAELMGGRNDVTYEKLGAASFHITRSSGYYPQLNFERGTLRGGSPSDFKRFARLLASVLGAFYNFSHMQVDMPEQGDTQNGWRAEAHWMDVGALPACLCPITRGYIRAVFERATGRPVRIEGERPAPDRFLFRMQIAAA